MKRNWNEAEGSAVADAFGSMSIHLHERQRSLGFRVADPEGDAAFEDVGEERATDFFAPAVHQERQRALAAFESARRPRVEQLQQAALESLRWFEEMDAYMHLDPLPFALAAMTRSKRIDYDKLRQRDPAFVAEVEQYQRGQTGTGTGR